jgi:hypothetical protein
VNTFGGGARETVAEYELPSYVPVIVVVPQPTAESAEQAFGAVRGTVAVVLVETVALAGAATTVASLSVNETTAPLAGAL